MTVQVLSAPSINDALEVIELLPPEDQTMLIEIVQRRMQEWRRKALIGEVNAARQAYQRGEFRRGSVDDLMAELDSA
jgi:hypothetical protein